MTLEHHLKHVSSRFGIVLDSDTLREYDRSATSLRDHYQSLTPVELTSESASQVTAGDDEFNAIRYEFDLPTNDGPLDDLSVGIKDSIAVAGVPMHCGSAALEFMPEYHATVVERLQQAGANITVTTNMDEFAYFTTGETCAFDPIINPHAPERVPGGSSSGSAAAVAAGLVDAALGGDTAGSIRIPASFCRVVGLKPTHRAVSRFGVADLSPSLDCIGPFGKNVETVARVFDALSGPDPRDESSLVNESSPPASAGLDVALDGLNVGLLNPALDGAEDDVSQHIEDVSQSLTECGVEIDEIDLPRYQRATEAGLAIVGTEFAAIALSEAHTIGTGTGYSHSWAQAIGKAVQSDELSENIRKQLILHAALCQDDVSYYIGAKNEASAFITAVDAILNEYDAVLLPTTPMSAPPFGAIDSASDFQRTVSNTMPFNVSGHPALSVPLPAEGVLAGVQFVGRRFDEQTLIALGRAVEESAI